MKERYLSLDVFRGATVAGMILVNNPGSWNHIFPPLEHASWHGCTPTDLVFPFFLFAVGNAMALVLPRLQEQGMAAAWTKIIKRTLLIALIGLLLNYFPFVKYNEAGMLVAKTWSSVRIMGVLQRIALCYFVAASLLLLLKERGAFVAAGSLLLLYWLACVAGNPADPYSLKGWFGNVIDMSILGESHMYHGEGVAFDPEGLVSTPAAIVQVLFGYFAGQYIQHNGKQPSMLNGLFVSGLVLVFCGFCWDQVFPINKKIWTSSYTIYTSGLALLVLGVMIWLLEFRNAGGWWSRFFNVFGKNPLFIFVLSGALPRALALIRIPAGIADNGKSRFLSPLGWFYEKVCAPLFTAVPEYGSLLYALCFICLMWAIAWWLNEKKIYIRV